MSLILSAILMQSFQNYQKRGEGQRVLMVQGEFRPMILSTWKILSNATPMSKTCLIPLEHWTLQCFSVFILFVCNFDHPNNYLFIFVMVLYVLLLYYVLLLDFSFINHKT